MKPDNFLVEINNVIENIREKHRQVIYVLSGTEQYYIFRTRQKISEALLENSSGSKEEIYESDEIQITELLEKLHSPSLFEPFRVVTVKNVEYFSRRSGTDIETLSEWIQRASKSPQNLPAALICTTESLDKRLSITKAVKKHGVLLEFNVAKSYERGDIRKDPYYPPATDYLVGAGKEITPEAWQDLRLKVPNNLWSVINSLEILIAFSGDRMCIQSEDVQELIAFGDETPVFALTEALGQKDPIKLRVQLDKLLNTGTHALMINKMLTSRMRILILLKAVLETDTLRNQSLPKEYWRFKRDTFPEIKNLIKQELTFSKLLGSQHPYSMFLNIQQAEKISESDLTRCLEELSKVDVSLKSTAKSPQILLEMALLPLCS